MAGGGRGGSAVGHTTYPEVEGGVGGNSPPDTQNPTPMMRTMIARIGDGDTMIAGWACAAAQLPCGSVLVLTD